MARRPVEQSIVERSREARSACVVFRDPPAKAVGGRAPWAWREPLSDPHVVAQGPGKRLSFRRANGFATGETHVVEKVVRIREVGVSDRQFPGMRAEDASGP
eukprot:3035921-Alexandrium_andersonii.AAC.1